MRQHDVHSKNVTGAAWPQWTDIARREITRASVDEISEAVACAIYETYIEDTGYDPPRTYADLLMFVELSGCPVGCCGDAPSDFHGVLLNRWVYVNAGGHLTDHERTRILAHEWAHWIRECVFSHKRLYLYGGNDESDVADGRALEERVARAFERLF